MKITVIGGGLAGCEAAWMVSRLGHPVELYEMKPKRFSPAHKNEGLAEIVCSNSFGSEAIESAPGLLKDEMNALGSLLLKTASEVRVPAGRALAVDRDRFSQAITETIEQESFIRLVREECIGIPTDGIVIVATGPLTSDALTDDLAKRVGTEALYFYDAISPIVTADSIDLTKTYFASRYDAERDDYLNCPMDRVTYEKFVAEIQRAEKVPVRSFEAMRCFESCLPIEVLADRGPNALAFGPMKPVGLEDPRTGKRPHAVVQLRRENDPTTLYNLVGFQTRMKWGEQQRIFRMIPGLEQAEFARLGSMHRNTYFDSPRLLNADLKLKAEQRILIAGQLTGVEGYVESAAMGLWAAFVAVAQSRNLGMPPIPPPETAMGALLKAITTVPLHGSFAPMNINFGLLPPVEGAKLSKEGRRRAMIDRARKEATLWRRKLTGLFGMEVLSRRPLGDYEVEMNERAYA